MVAYNIRLNRGNPDSLDGNATCLDRRGPFCNLALDVLTKIKGSRLIIRDDFGVNVLQTELPGVLPRRTSRALPPPQAPLRVRIRYRALYTADYAL